VSRVRLGSALGAHSDAAGPGFRSDSSRSAVGENQICDILSID